MIRPNFFLIGAPKCGTTAMAQYLAENPRVCMSELKEPGYWSDDIPLPPGDFLGGYPQSLEDYLGLFKNATSVHVAIGEASTSYAWSATAVRRILAFQPDAKFICMVRNPLEMVYALHATEVFFLNEPDGNFESAWRRREERAQSNDLNLRIRLDYRRIASLGTHVSRLFRDVPENQRHIIVYDDFVRDTQQCYERVLAFLNVPTDGRNTFPVVNGAKEHRCGLVPQLLMQPPAWSRPFLKRVVHPTLKRLGVRNVRENILARFSAKRPRPKLSAEFRQELATEFREEIELLSSVLGRDLNHWLDDAPKSQPTTESLLPNTVPSEPVGV